MPATTKDGHSKPPVPADARRPSAGISIDPARLTWWRWSRGWSRQDLSDAIAALHLINEDSGQHVTITRDAIAKNENGERKPLPVNVRAYCAALSTPENPCLPHDLLPGGPPLTPHEDLLTRRSRLDHNRELRAFAIRHGIRYKNDGSGRIYYSKLLRAAYDLMVDGASDADVEAAAAAARDAQLGPQDSGPDARDQELLAS